MQEAHGRLLRMRQRFSDDAINAALTQLESSRGGPLPAPAPLMTVPEAGAWNN